MRPLYHKEFENLKLTSEIEMLKREINEKEKRT